jgi:S-adenosylmethionine:tRNA ribosyltransferase-isomerase
MHAEFAEIPSRTWQTILEAKARGHHIWALGTTVTRTLESAAQGLLEKAEPEIACEHVISDTASAFFGETKLFIQPGYEFKIIDRLLTNFHQPRSTLIALVAAFAGLENVKRAYAWAIDLGFRLFSYGDLSVWYKADLKKWER